MVPRLLNNLANNLIPKDHAYIISDTCLPIGPLKNLNLFGFVFLLLITYTQLVTTTLQPPIGSFDTLIRIWLLRVFVECRLQFPKPTTYFCMSLSADCSLIFEHQQVVKDDNFLDLLCNCKPE